MARSVVSSASILTSLRPPPAPLLAPRRLFNSRCPTRCPIRISPVFWRNGYFRRGRVIRCSLFKLEYPSQHFMEKLSAQLSRIQFNLRDLGITIYGERFMLSA